MVPAATVAVAVIAVFFLQMQSEVTPVMDPEMEMFANVDPQDYDIVSDLNDVLPYDDSNSLDETIFR